jgi:hypothetical protein
MCGLVGVAGASGGKMDKVFRTLLILDTVRGEHSTGVLIVNASGQCDIHKAVGNPFELFDSRKYYADLAYNNNVLLGHNRYATKGAVNKTNAHPFEHGHLYGAHNGTLSTQWKLDDHLDYIVDSDNLYHHMELNGVQKTTPLLGGAYALSWWDAKDNTINLLRNAERPLCFAFTKDRKNVMWASEYWMIEVACAKAGVEFVQILELPVAKHYSLEIPLAVGGAYPVLGSFKSQAVTEYEVPKPVVVKSNVTVLHSNKDLTGTVPVDLPVEFTVLGVHPTIKHALMCRLEDYPDLRCQFNCKLDGVFYKKMINSKNILFEGNIKRITSKSSTPLVVIDKKTIKEVYVEDLLGDDDGVFIEKEEEWFSSLEVNGKTVTEAEYNCATMGGCSCCGDPAVLHDSGTLTWVNNETFVCGWCIEDQRIKEHYGMN